MAMSGVAYGSTISGAFILLWALTRDFRFIYALCSTISANNACFIHLVICAWTVSLYSVYDVDGS